MIETLDFMGYMVLLGYLDILSVPCSYLKGPIHYAINEGMYLPVCNEADAIAMSAGMSMAGRKNAVFLQNSGLANSVSPLSSLQYIFDIPCLMLMGYRGSGPDEPQHELMGKITESMLLSLGVEPVLLQEGTQDAIAQLKAADKSITQGKRSVALLVRKDLFDAVPLEGAADPAVGLRRASLLQCLAELRDKDTIVVTTTGFTSRELYQLRDDPLNFYMVGSMGCAAAVGAGIARAMPRKKVVVVDGDGAVWMRGSFLPVLAAERPPNFLHIVLANHAYESTGNQPLPKEHMPLDATLRLAYGQDFLRTDSEIAFTDAVGTFLDAPTFRCLYAEICSQSLDVLQRPKETTRQLGDRFRNALRREGNKG